MLPVHHHRSTTKVDNKPFKTRFSTKGTLRGLAKGKIENKNENRGKRRTPYQQVMSKLDRRNQAKQIRMHHKEKQEQESNIFHGIEGAAKHIAMIPISRSIDTKDAIKRLNESVDVENPDLANPNIRVKVERFRRNLIYLTSSPDLLQVLDICKLADWVVFVLDAEQRFEEEQKLLLRAIEGQGITNVAIVVQNVETKIGSSKRARALTELKISMGHYFPSLDKLFSLDSKPDCANLVRSFCTASSRGIRWRDDRSWMLIENINWTNSSDDTSTSTTVLSGTIRGKGLNPDRLVHLPGWGDFQIKSIRQIYKQNEKHKPDLMMVDEIQKEWRPSGDRDSLEELAPEVEMALESTTVATNNHKGVLLDDHHYFSDDESHIPPPPKKLPKGTSSYQAAWYLDDVTDSGSDMEDEDEEGDIGMSENKNLEPEDGIISNDPDTKTGVEPSEYPESEIHVDHDEDEEARQLEEFRSNRKLQADEDFEFPDEVELPPNALARERLAKYRGLKSLRTSQWNNEEDAPYEPLDYKRLLQVVDYKKSKNAATREAFARGVPAGTRVEVEIEGIPNESKKQPPICLFSLLRHEHKHAVINLNMTLHSTTEQPVKSKEELIVQIGHRRLTINPIFSASGQTPNDVHKFDRFLYPGRTAIATFIGPMTWGSVPVLVFKRQSSSEDEPLAPVDAMTDDISPKDEHSSNLKLIGSATTIPPSHSRVIAKRIILTGHPYKINKKLVTVRYMFFNREDVAWFAALPLWTKRGRQGFIKEGLGTHGYFKATFDGKINPADAIGVSLYKRVWPRSSRPYP